MIHVTYECHQMHPKQFQSLWYVWHKQCTYLVLRFTLSPNRLKWASTRFITEEYHWVCPKWFQSLWYIRPKSCTYLASRLTLSPNRPKQASTWSTSPRQRACWINCLSDCIQNPTISCFQIETFIFILQLSACSTCSSIACSTSDLVARSCITRTQRSLESVYRLLRRIIPGQL